jgi:hypothetical protein
MVRLAEDYATTIAQERHSQVDGPLWLGWSGKVAAGNELETRSVRHKNIEYVVTDLSKEGFGRILQRLPKKLAKAERRLTEKLEAFLKSATKRPSN